MWQSSPQRRPVEQPRLKIDLSSRIRDIKRELFSNGEAKIDLKPNVSGSLSLRAVFEDNDFERLGGELQLLRDTVLKSAFGKHLEAIGLINRTLGQAYPVHVLLTGGALTFR